MERRSKWKNSMKSAQQPEDDLLTPAHAINPNAPDDVAMGLGSGGGGGPGGSGKKGKKGKVGGGKKMDASFLLGFSVSSSDRVNAGDIDLPQWTGYPLYTGNRLLTTHIHQVNVKFNLFISYACWLIFFSVTHWKKAQKSFSWCLLKQPGA